MVMGNSYGNNNANGNGNCHGMAIVAKTTTILNATYYIFR